MAMDQAAEKSLKRFSDLANKGHLHPEDWRRFYDFVILIHRLHLIVPSEAVRDFLRGEGFLQHSVGELTSVYSHGLELLRQSDWNKPATPA